MKLNLTNGIRTSLLVGLGLCGSAGCQTDKSSVTEFFPAEGAQRIHNFADVQTANGAQEDATLQPAHFDGPRLNSLGEDKLDRMVFDDAQETVVVYLSLAPGDASNDARTQAVTEYLKERGIDPSRVKVETGTNPATSTPAATGLARMAKTETGGGEGESSTDDSLGGAGFMEMGDGGGAAK
jgi:hypothetical protein